MALKGGKPENLKPFKKGKDSRRNMDGRPKKLPILEQIIAEVLAKEGNDGITAVQKIIEAQQAKALKGDTQAFNSLMDRGYGRVKQPVDISLQMPDLESINLNFK